MTVLALAAFCWCAGVLVSWLPFWWWRTGSTLPRAHRRARALGHAVLWPYHLAAYFAGRGERGPGLR